MLKTTSDIFKTIAGIIITSIPTIITTGAFIFFLKKSKLVI